MMRKTAIKVVTIAVLVAIVAAATTWIVIRRPPDTIGIGLGAPLSGGLASLGKDMQDGAQLAIDEINADGGMRLAGKRVRLALVSADDRADPVAGVEAARQLVNGQVAVAIAHLNSGVSIAAAPIYSAAGIPQMAISTKPDYTRLNLPTTLRLVANDDMQSRAISSYAMQIGSAERTAIVDDGTPYGTGLAEQVSKLIKSPGRELCHRASMDNRTVEFAALVDALKRSNCDLLITTLSDFQVASLVEQLAKAGLTNMRLLSGDTIKTDQAKAWFGKIAGIYATSPILEPREFPSGRTFLTKFRGRFGHDPVYGAHYIYDAVYLVADAMSRNESVDRDKLLARLKSFDGNAPVTGQMRFDDRGEQRYGAVTVYKLTASQWEPLMRSDKW